MKEKKGLLFIIALIIFLCFAIFLFQINGKYLFGYQIKFVSLDDFRKEQVKKDSPILKKSEKSIQNEWPLKAIQYSPKSEIELQKYVDSLIAGYTNELNDSAFKESPYLINSPVNGKYPLDSFFENLSKTNVSRNLFRVGHYGDSQIEGDRMTSILRKLFQLKFGGNGVGYLPMDDVTDPISYIRRPDASWNRHTIFSNKLKGFAYGPGGSVYRYFPSLNATVTINLLSPYQTINILYGYGSDDSFLEVYSSKNKLLGQLPLNKKSVFNKTKIVLSSNEMNLRFAFRGNSPCIYGLTFDPLYGIQFDNYGLRGQAGDGLLTIPQNQLMNMFDETQTKMAILQFGGNIIPGLRTEKIIQLYGGIYKKLYLHFKESLHSGSILIIGVNDVSHAVHGNYQSYPNISELRYIQRKLSIENGLAFFDIYQLMGGENSISVLHEKGLASRDGHYSDKARDMVCKALFKGLIYEYNQFLKRKELVNE